jgi:hypothetical protein
MPNMKKKIQLYNLNLIFSKKEVLNPSILLKMTKSQKKFLVAQKLLLRHNAKIKKRAIELVIPSKVTLPQM